MVGRRRLKRPEIRALMIPLDRITSNDWNLWMQWDDDRPFHRIHYDGEFIVTDCGQMYLPSRGSLFMTAYPQGEKRCHNCRIRKPWVVTVRFDRV